jgi:hypothetical protein
MAQRSAMTDKEKYDMYNSLEKDVLIGMLIECNKHIRRMTPTLGETDTTCRFYMSGTDTSARCIHCGKTKWEHP